MICAVTHVASLPRRFPNKLREIGRPISVVLKTIAWMFFKIIQGVWALVVLIVTGGKYGSWVDREYGDYYRSDHWKDVRMKAIKLNGHRCAVCGENYLKRGRRLTVRHTQHIRDGQSVYGREDVEKDLIVLCEDHNQKGSRTVRHVQSWKSAYRWYGAFSQ